jgi:uncharacterized membrane protein HdeD (DUF308 family)
MLPGFGAIWFPAPQWFVGIVSAGIAFMWFLAAYLIRVSNPNALLLTRITAIFNLVLIWRALNDGVPFVDMMWAIILISLALVLSFLPEATKALARPTPEGAVSEKAAMPAATESVAEDATTRTGPPPWWSVALEGALLVLISLYLIRTPTSDWEEITWLISIYWSISGVMNMIKLYFNRSMLGLKIAAGASGIVVGLFLILYLNYGYIDADLKILLFLGIIIGAANLIQGFRGSGWGTAILGIAGMAVAVLLLAAQADIIYDLLPWLVVLLSGIGGTLAIIASTRMRRQQLSSFQ